MLIDESMPDYLVRLRREIVVAAASDRVFAAILTTDFGELRIVRYLHPRGSWLRRWHLDVSEPRQPPFRLLDLRRLGFVVLGEHAGETVVLGAVLRLWSVRPQPQRVPAEFFVRFARTGFVKTAVAFSVEAISANKTRLIVEVRFLPADRSSRRRFRIGFSVGRLIVGAAQREALLLIARKATDSTRRVGAGG